MIWIAPSEKEALTTTLEKRLWDAADQFRADAGLTFIRFAEVRFAAQRAKLEKAGPLSCCGSRVDKPPAYRAGGFDFVLPNALFKVKGVDGPGRHFRSNVPRTDIATATSTNAKGAIS